MPEPMATPSCSAKPLSERVEEYDQKPERNPQLFTIFKVPVYIREVDTGASEPKMVSIGPYHRGKKTVECMEEHKLRFLRRFLSRCRPKPLGELTEELKALEKDVRSRYSESIDNMSAAQLAEMLLLDGVFIIEFMLMRVRKMPSEDALRTPLMRNCVTLEMLMLENQIPFSVLRKLYESIDPSAANLVTRACRFLGVGLPRQGPAAEFHHLLHLFRSCIVPAPTADATVNPNSRTIIMQNSSSRTEAASEIPTNWIPNAVKLAEAGVKFKVKKRGSPLEVTFSDGVVEMALLPMDDRTNFIYRNLVAFEHCHPISGAYVTEYFTFMDRLVDDSADVALLQHAGVLINLVGSEEEAAILINRLCKFTIIEGDNHLTSLFRAVNVHYRSRWPRWRAKLVRDYFGNPWSIISLAAAAVLLILAFVQTYYTALGYEKPK